MRAANCVMCQFDVRWCRRCASSRAEHGGSMTKLRNAVTVSLFAILLGCGSNGSSSAPPAEGGASGTGGDIGTGGASTSPLSGSGGSPGAGGNLGTGGATSPSSGGSGGSAGAGGSSGSSVQVTCSALSTGCTCSSGKPGASDPATCSKSSVATSASDKGSCCKSSFFCTCTSYSCILDSSLGRCFCDTTSTLTALVPSGTKLDQCPAPKSGNKCCYDSTLNSCDCNHTSCSATATEVAACTLAQLTACGSGVAVDSCK